MNQFRHDIRYVEVPNGDIMDDPTNVFIVGQDPVVLIDTGSLYGIDVLLQALYDLGNPDVSTILLTHVHIDHAESTSEIQRRTGATVRFHEAELPELAATTTHQIQLDQPMVNGETLDVARYRFEAVLTPGHAAGHLSFIEQAEHFGFVGDLVTGSGSSAVFPPWGDLSDYINSMQAVAERGINPLLPSHGEPVKNGPEALRHFVRRRLEREQQILAIIDGREMSVEAVRDSLYENVPQDLLSDVTGNVMLHLEKLEREGHVVRRETEGGPAFTKV